MTLRRLSLQVPAECRSATASWTVNVIQEIDFAMQAMSHGYSVATANQLACAHFFRGFDLD